MILWNVKRISSFFQCCYQKQLFLNPLKHFPQHVHCVLQYTCSQRCDLEVTRSSKRAEDVQFEWKYFFVGKIFWQKTSLCLASFLGCQRDASGVCWWAPSPAIDVYLLSAWRSAANPPMGQTNKRTYTWPFRRPCSACYAGSFDKVSVSFAMKRCVFVQSRSFERTAGPYPTARTFLIVDVEV